MNATYVYDALGRRIQKNIFNISGGMGGITGDIPANIITYLYDGQQIVEERSVYYPATWTKLYFWGQYIDELMVLATPTATYRVLSDLLYRGTAMVNTSNVIQEAYDTDAYGNTLCYSGPGTDGLWFTNDDVRTNNPVNPFIFTGRQFDLETQIYYYRARYYAPQWGRFLSRDPIGMKGGINLYEYVRGRSTIWKDPFGKTGGKCTEGSNYSFSGSGWQVVAYTLHASTGADYRAFYNSIDVTWEASVSVDCKCCTSDTGTGTRTYTKNNISLPEGTGAPTTEYAPITLPTMESIYDGIIDLLGDILGDKIPPIAAPPLDPDIASIVNNYKPTTANSGAWKSGSPCK